MKLFYNINFNPLVHDAHHSECKDKSFSLQIQLIEADLKPSCGFLFFAPNGNKWVKKPPASHIDPAFLPGQLMGYLTADPF